MTEKWKIVTIWMVFIFVTLFSGCAYFNTFYNARQYFAQAEKEYESHNKLTSAANTYYQKVIEKSSKVIELYPDSKYVDDAIYLMGVSYFRLNEYRRARRKFEELLRYFPQSPYADKARIWLARIYMQNGDYDLARQELRQLPPSEDVELTMIRAYFEEGQYDKAIESALDFLSKYRRSKYRPEIYRYLSEAYEAEGNYEKARQYLKKYQSSKSLTDQELNELKYKLARLYYLSGQYDSTITLLEKMEFLSRDTLKPYAKLLMGMAYEAKGDTTSAKLAYQYVVDSLRTISSAQIEASFNLAKIYEAQDSTELAIQQYRRTASLRGQSPYKGEANRLYHALTTVRQIGSDTSGSDTSASSLLTLAETYMFDLRKPAAAESIYMRLAREQAGDYIGAKALYALVYLRLNMTHDTLAAANAYAKLLSWYPGTIYAEEAERIFGDALSTYADTIRVEPLPEKVKPSSVASDTVAATPSSQADSTTITTSDTTGTVPDAKGISTRPDTSHAGDTTGTSAKDTTTSMPAILKPDTVGTKPPADTSGN